MAQAWSGLLNDTEASAFDDPLTIPPEFDSGAVQLAETHPGQVRLTAVLAAISLLQAIVGGLAGNDPLVLVGGYGVVFVGIGAAPFQLMPRLGFWARSTGAVLIGFVVLLGLGALMVDLQHLWYPVPVAIVVCVAAAALHLEGLRRLERLRPRAGAERLGASNTRAALILRLSVALTLIGTGLWLVPALSTNDANAGVAGFLPVISPVWYAGLVVVVIAFALGRRGELSAGVAALSFGLASTLTPALVYATADNQTAAKQMELTQYVLHHHHVHVTAGIYQAFSALFAGVAWLCDLLGIHGMLGPHSLLTVATSWPVLLVFMRIAVLRLLAGRLLPTTSRRWAAVMLVLLVDSLGDDYFSPQSVGYVMAIGALALVVRGITPRPLRGRALFFVLAAVGCVLAPTHELSPYILTGALVVLVIFKEAPLWSPLTVAVPTLAWTGFVHHAIGQNFSFAYLFNLSNFSPPGTLATPGLHRLAIVGYQSDALLAALLILIALGAIGFFANIRHRWAWAYGLCPFVGIALIAINPYGNEGIFRACLFAIPWIAMLAMKMPHPGRLLVVLRWPAALTGSISALLVALLATFVVAAYGMDSVNVLFKSDVAAVDYLRALPPRNAFVLAIGSDFNPAAYPAFTVDYRALEWNQVNASATIRSRHPGPAALAMLTKVLRAVAKQRGATPTSPIYVYWSHSLLLYAQAYALLSPPQMRAWLHLLQTSPHWRLVHRDGQTYLFQLR